MRISRKPGTVSIAEWLFVVERAATDSKGIRGRMCCDGVAVYEQDPASCLSDRAWKCVSPSFTPTTLILCPT
jgi:hypothetical protein